MFVVLACGFVLNGLWWHGCFGVRGVVRFGSSWVLVIVVWFDAF